MCSLKQVRNVKVAQTQTDPVVIESQSRKTSVSFSTVPPGQSTSDLLSAGPASPVTQHPPQRTHTLPTLTSVDSSASWLMASEDAGVSRERLLERIAVLTECNQRLIDGLRGAGAPQQVRFLLFFYDGVCLLTPFSVFFCLRIRFGDHQVSSARRNACHGRAMHRGCPQAHTPAAAPAPTRS